MNVSLDKDVKGRLSLSAMAVTTIFAWSIDLKTNITV